MSAQSSTLAQRYRVWLTAAIVALITLVIFVPALDNEFVNWDDDLNFIYNFNYRGLGLEQLKWMFTTFHMGHYHPLTWITLGMDYCIWKMNPAGYHLTNVILHAATAAAFVLLALQLYRIVYKLSKDQITTSILIAAATAAGFFAIHPLRVESVAWITERRDCLSGLFFILTLYAYLRYAYPEQQLRTRILLYILSVVCLTFSLLSKAWGITLPAVLIVLDIYPLRRLVPGRWFSGHARRIWYEKIPFAVLAVVTAILARQAQSTVGAMWDIEHHGIYQRFAQSAYGIMFYLVKTLWPTNLIPTHIFFGKLDPTTSAFLTAQIAVLLITAILIWQRKRWPALLTVWIIYIVILSPVSGIAQSGLQLAADRYSYLACLGWALLAGAGAKWLWQRNRQFIVITCLALAFVVLGLLTWKQTNAWQTSESLWNHTLRIDPNNVTANLLKGDILARQKKYKEAIAFYQRAFEQAPNYVEVHANLGISLAALNRFEAAEPHLIFAAEHKKPIPSLKIPDAALQSLVPTLRALAVTQVVLGRPSACDTISRVIDLEPTDLRYLNQLYKICLQKARFAEAIHLLRSTLKHHPQDSELTRQLAWQLATAPQADLRDGKIALRLLQPIVEAAGDNADPRLLDILAAAYAEIGNFEQARQTAETALKQSANIDPALRKQINQRLKLYTNNTPYRQVK